MIALAVIATAIWIKLVIWRVGRHPSAIWKSLILPAGGSSLCWVLLMSLWLPFLDHAMSYKAWTNELTQIIGSDKCIYFSNIDRHQIAGFTYHGNIQFEPISSPDHKCNWLMEKPNQEANATIHSKNDWILKQTMQRPGDKRDVVLLFERAINQKHD